MKLSSAPLFTPPAEYKLSLFLVVELPHWNLRQLVASHLQLKSDIGINIGYGVHISHSVNGEFRPELVKDAAIVSDSNDDLRC